MRSRHFIQFCQGLFVLILVCESIDLVFSKQDCDTAKQSPPDSTIDKTILRKQVVLILSTVLQVVTPDLEPFLFDV